MLQSYHQNAEQFEILFNKTKYDALPARMRAIIDNGVEAASQDLVWKSIDRYSKDYEEMQSKDNVRFYITPPSILQAQLEAYDGVASKKMGENPLFKEIIDSQRAFAQRVVRWDFANNVDRHMAYNHYFGRQAAGKGAPAKDAGKKA
jgi:TRAP-type mannitol/chloroaromatic compound transport system substrate-binding protein